MDEDQRTDVERLEWAIEALRYAIEKEGPRPWFHRKIMRRHRRQWPTLWAAIDRLLER